MLTSPQDKGLKFIVIYTIYMYNFYVSLSNKWKTTVNPQGPNGRKEKDTFRDVSIAGASPENIDAIDAECIERGISRSALAMELLGTDEGFERFKKQFRNAKHYRSWFVKMEREGELEPEREP